MDTIPTKHNYGRLIFAALMAPLVGATAIIMFMGVYAVAEGSNLNAFFIVWLYALGFGAAIGWPAMVIAGLPLHALIHAKGLRHVLVYAVAGGVAGALATIVFMLVMGTSLGNIFGREFELVLKFGISTGAISATAFHLIRGPIKHA